MSKIRIPDLGSVGLMLDTQPVDLPLSALSDVLNIRFRDGAAERISGDVQVFTAPAVVPYALQVFNTNDQRYLVHAGLSAVYADTDTTRTNITGTAPTGLVGNRWSTGVLNGVLVLNNGVDLPQYWGGNLATPLAALPAFTSTWRCAVLRPFKNYLVGLDWTKGAARYPQMVKWSSAADPGTTPASWNEADPSNDAGELDLAETADELIDALPLGDALIIYKRASMYAMTYIGGQYIFQFRRLPGEAGMLARGCACITPQGHVVLTAGDVVMHNGAGTTSILTGKMRRWLFAQIDTTYYARAFVVSNPSLNEAWVCFPTSGNSTCNRALIWNWAENTLSLRELSGVTCGTSAQFDYTTDPSWAANAQPWSEDITRWNQSDLALAQNQLVLGSTAPLLSLADSGVDFHGSAFTAILERTGLAFDAPDRVKLARALYPRIDGATGQSVYIQLGGAMDVEGAITWSDPVAYVIGSSFRADSFASGRFLAWRIYASGSFAWRVRSIDIDVVVQGAY